MNDGTDPLEETRRGFPGPAFWKLLESFLSAVGLGTPKRIFKLRQARARWEERRVITAGL